MQIGGLASGLDTIGLVDQLINIERRPIIQLNTRKGTWQKQIDAWRDINTRLNSLATKTASLNELSVFQAQQVTSTNDEVLSASSSGGSLTGNYNITVHSLATSTSIKSSSSISKPINSANTLNTAGFSITPTSGTFSINGVEISVDAATESLDDLITKINNSGAGVTATYDSISDKLNLVSGSGIQLGSGSDTSNFLSATRILAETDGTKTSVSSSSKLGGSKTNLSLQDARFVSAFSNTTGSFLLNGVEFTYDTTVDTLSDIIKRVNDSKANVTLSYDSVNDQISMKSKATGSIDISLKDSSGNFLDVLGLNSGIKNLGKNASFTINDSTLSSVSNSVSGIIEGLTFELKSEGQATISIKQDVDSTLNNIKSFVEQYNDVQGFISSKMAKEGTLQGDSGLMSIQSSLRTKTTGLVGGIETDFKMLSSIGIDSDRTGQLTIDEKKLREAISEKSYSVYQLFNSADGIATRLEKDLEALTKSGSGVISEKQKTYEDRIKDINNRVKIMEERLERKRDSLMRQFTAMEKAMSTMMNQGAWLEGQLGQMSGWGISK